MRAAPNLAPAFVAKFDSMYPALATKHEATLYPFLLENAVGRPGMMQSDGIHPTFAGVKAIVTSILPTVKRALARP